MVPQLRRGRSLLVLGADWDVRLTGIRCEELLELTHVSIVPYRIPSTEEEIPLLHIAPSKTDEERLLVADPELVHVCPKSSTVFVAGTKTSR